MKLIKDVVQRERMKVSGRLSIYNTHQNKPINSQLVVRNDSELD